MTRPTIYCISGQAADERLFENLSWPKEVNVKYIRWIEPLKNETLAHYANRMMAQMDDDEDFLFVGVSLGGIMAIELNKMTRPKRIIIISSISTNKELPALYRLIKLLRLQQWVPSIVFKWYSPLVNWFFGARTERERTLFKEYMQTATANYMRWSVNAVVNWRNQIRPSNLFHIHGTHDLVFPYKTVKADVLIDGGTHMLVHNRAEEVSQLIAEQLKKYGSSDEAQWVQES